MILSGFSLLMIVYKILLVYLQKNVLKYLSLWGVIKKNILALTVCCVHAVHLRRKYIFFMYDLIYYFIQCFIVLRYCTIKS